MAMLLGFPRSSGPQSTWGLACHGPQQRGTIRNAKINESLVTKAPTTAHMKNKAFHVQEAVPPWGIFYPSTIHTFCASRETENLLSSW
mmetsp:Transcript_10502/g.21607  ORF Transcript_10502/g.21607 Transcript_10502/m.21607 type:complete len:88 (+) Transcript_10502:304-567(+)